MSRGKDFIFEPFKVIEVKYRSSDRPRPRSGHRIACDEGYLYCFGGYNPSLPLNNIERVNPTWSPSRPLFKELWSFCFGSGKWKLHDIAENMPEELASNAMCIVGVHLMIYGGTGEPFGHKCNNDVIAWHTVRNDRYLRILHINGPKPPGLYGQSILYHNKYLYTVGGTNGYAYNCDIFRLDIQTMRWEALFVGVGQEDEPLGRYRHEVVRNGNKLYIIGGGTGDWAFELMEIPMFDLDTRTWQILIAKPDESGQEPVTPLPRKCHSAVQIDTPNGVQVFVVGGSDGHSVYDDIWRLNITDMRWTLMKQTKLPHPLYFHSSSITPSGCMYIFGGIEPKNEVTRRNNTLYKVWVCVPKLSEICFEAILHFNPNLDLVDDETLCNMGIPKHFTQRLRTMEYRLC